MPKTKRGFIIDEFEDRSGHRCSLQKSSIASEDCIWLGIDDPKPQILAPDAILCGIPTNGQTLGWMDYHIPKEVLLHTRMHLSQEQVLQLLPSLIHFATTGELIDSETQTADIMKKLLDKE